MRRPAPSRRSRLPLGACAVSRALRACALSAPRCGCAAPALRRRRRRPPRAPPAPAPVPGDQARAAEGRRQPAVCARRAADRGARRRHAVRRRADGEGELLPRRAQGRGEDRRACSPSATARASSASTSRAARGARGGAAAHYATRAAGRVQRALAGRALRQPEPRAGRARPVGAAAAVGARRAPLRGAAERRLRRRRPDAR